MSGRNTIWIIILLVYVLGASRSGDTVRFYYDIYFEENSEAANYFPKDMADYLAEALKNEDVIESLDEIVA